MMAIQQNIDIKLQIPAGKAIPASAIGPALGQHGINIIKFCKDFNLQTKENIGLIYPVIITIYPDKNYSFIIKDPPTSVLIKKILGLPLTKKPGSGSKMPGKEIVASITYSQLENIAKMKKNDLNSYDIKTSIKIIKGTAKSMGISIKE